MREKPIPEVKDPPAPLRSTQWPDGLPGLDHANKLKTELANQVYAATASVVQWAALHAVEVVVENPLRSRMSDTFLAPAGEHLPEHIVFQACMHGGGRDKFTMLRASSGMLQPLAVLCDGARKHLPWQPKAMTANSGSQLMKKLLILTFFVIALSGVCCTGACSKVRTLWFSAKAS